MPESVAFHCAVAISDKAVLIIGGYASNPDFSSKTKIYDFESMQWNDGPELTTGRKYHACASLEMTDNWVVYVVGGDPVTDSMEWSVIDQDNSIGEWNEGTFSFLLLGDLQTLQTWLFNV